MGKKIPAPGKKWATNKAQELSVMLNGEIQKLDRAELEALILTCKQFTNTNCGWTSFGTKSAIIYLSEAQLRYITPTSQLKKPNKTSKP